MKQININVSGDPGTDRPALLLDAGGPEVLASLTSGRAAFALPASAAVGTGATIRYQFGFIRVLVPPDGAWEADLPPVKPKESTTPIALVYALPAAVISVDGERFLSRGQPLFWKGVTDFRLAQRSMAGEDIRPILKDRISVGANLLRMLGMKTQNTGWDLVPAGRADYFGDMRRVFDVLAPTGLLCEWTVFADTRYVMPDQHQQLDFWQRALAVARDYPFVLLELCNEWNHPTQFLVPSAFPRPSGILSSHGSGQTDEDVVRPTWDYAAYHSRRLQWSGDARGATNYSPYAYQENVPKACPFVSDEGPKPEDYGFNTAYARLMGQHARCGAGGTFHFSGGIDSRLMTDQEKACAAAFFEALS